MFSQYNIIPRIVAAMPLIFAAAPTLAQGNDADDPVLGKTDVSTVPKIGRLQRRIQRAIWWEELNRELTGVYSDYSQFKSEVKKDTGLSWSMPVSYLQQWGLPDGGWPAGQILATPGLDWEMFNSETFGAGSLQVSYTLVKYPWQQTAAAIAGNLGIITQINDFPGNGEDSFDQLTYTQAFPGNKLLLSIGQYPFYNFDDNQYLADQQQNFDNLLLLRTAARPTRSRVSAPMLKSTSPALSSSPAASRMPPTSLARTSRATGLAHNTLPGSAMRSGRPNFTALVMRNTRLPITMCPQCRCSRAAAPAGRSTPSKT
ncbi:MAG: hypothetical protein P8Y25_15045 [Chromatiaceae bacterium]